MPAVFTTFEYETISDMVLHIQYTAQQSKLSGAEDEKRNVVTSDLRSPTSPLRLLISIRHNFPDESQQLRGGANVTVSLDDRIFPYFAHDLISPQKLIQILPPLPTSTTIRQIDVNSKLIARSINLISGDADGYFILEYNLT